MRATFLTTAACLLATAAGFVVPKHQTSEPRAPVNELDAATPLKTRDLPQGFATHNSSHFIIDGKAQYLAGSNSYWLPMLMNNADVDLALDQLLASGIKLLRIWGFADVTTIPSDPNTVWFQHLSASGSTINTGANGLQRLDYVVAAAEKRGIKLIIPFVNNWQDYGGIPAYTSAFGSGGSTWYKHDKAQAQYRLYIKTVIARYAASPAIFSWQLANEPRCMFCSTDDIFNWATSTSAYIKSLDPYHMVSLGDEGFGLNGASWLPYLLIYGTDYWRNIQIETLDFGTFHIYPSTWAVPNSFVNTWISSHAERCRYANKPCYMEECKLTHLHAIPR
jgi:mannan endo-1,4-beta-mannosidase